VADKGLRIKGFYGGARLKRMNVELTKKHLNQLGNCIVKLISREAKKDFAKRGWSGNAYDGTDPIWDSFSYRIAGGKTIEVVSTFPRIGMLTGDGVPEHDMTWLTQEAKDKHPEDYELTQGERRRRMRKAGKVSQGERLPLVVPVSQGTTVVFRTAPLQLQDAWVHPGIARFTFMERASRMVYKECAPIFALAVAQYLAKVSQGGR